MPGRLALLSSVLLVATAACAAAASKAPPPSSAPGSSTPGVTSPPGTSPIDAVDPSTPDSSPTRAAVTDNHVLLLGDSITESVGPRYSGAACTSLEPLGWNVTVDAHMGRNTTQATRELAQHLEAVHQVIVILIGHNDPVDPTSYQRNIEALLELVPAVPRVLLLTNYEFEQGRDRMNAVLREVAAADPRVQLVDWNAVVSTTDHAIGGDGLHLTSTGEEALGNTLATALGRAPDPTDPTPRTCTTIGSTTASGTTGSSGRSGSGGNGNSGSGSHRGGTTTDAPGTSTASVGSGPPSGSEPPPDSRPQSSTTNPPHPDPPHSDPPPSRPATSAPSIGTAAPAP